MSLSSAFLNSFQTKIKAIYWSVLITFFILIVIMFIQVSLLPAYVAIKKFDVVCLLETYLDSPGLSDNENFNLPNHNVVRADHPSNTKKGGVCIYFKNSLLFKVLDI